MAWTGIAREEHNRKGLRYPSDMTDREWAVVAPFIPRDCQEFRVRGGIMGKKETLYAPTQSPGYP